MNEIEKRQKGQVMYLVLAIFLFFLSAIKKKRMLDIYVELGLWPDKFFFEILIFTFSFFILFF